LIEHFCALPDQFIGRVDVDAEGSGRSVAGERFDLFDSHPPNHPASDAGMAAIVKMKVIDLGITFDRFPGFLEIALDSEDQSIQIDSHGQSVVLTIGS
jgi:hypothetical protein